MHGSIATGKDDSETDQRTKTISSRKPFWRRDEESNTPTLLTLDGYFEV